MPKTHILFSANSKLAYLINKRYYDNYHYVYVSSMFGCSELEPKIEANPPSSSPKMIYYSLKEESEAGDTQGKYIIANKAGLLRGAEAKFEAEEITETQRDHILAIINSAEASHFKPILYLIPNTKEIEEMLVPISPEDKPNPLSEEWKIKKLPGNCFKPIIY